jgi:hypothetical protein
MKLLIITIIVLVIPMFFAFVFAMSAVSKLTSLRSRCREVRERIQATPTPDPLATPVLEPQVLADFKLAVERYDVARTKFPGNLLAVLCGFHEIEPLPDRQIDSKRNGP